MWRAVLIALVGALAACDGRPTPRRDTPPAPNAAATDSARGDSAALATLPPRLAEAFAVGAVVTADALRDTARVRCELLSAPHEREERRRLRATLPDSARAVLFVRAGRDDRALRRVELVRRHRDGSQRGFIWTAEGDVVQGVEWPFGAPGPAETTTLPRGGPVPRAMRALGRRLLALACPTVRPPHA